LELKRLKYMDKKRIKGHEDDIMDKLNQFKKRLNSEELKNDKEAWMNNKLKFHIDSARAYNLNSSKERVNEIKDQIAAEGGQIDFRRPGNNDEGGDTQRNVRLEDVVTIEELIRMTEDK